MKRPNLTDESAGERVWMPKYPTERMVRAVMAEARKRLSRSEAEMAAMQAIYLYSAMVEAEGESAFFVEGDE